MSGEDINEYYVFTWRIKNYSCCFQRRGTIIKSPIFTLDNQVSGKVPQWCLSILPKADYSLKKSEKYVSLYLTCKIFDEIDESFKVIYSLEILDEMGRVLQHYGDFEHEFTEESRGVGYLKFMDIDDLNKEMHDWEEDILTLRCRIKHKNLIKPITVGSDACTVINVSDPRYLHWNFKSIKEMHSESIIFNFSDAYDFEISLKILSEGMELFFCLKRKLPDSSEPVFFTIRVSLCDKRGINITSKRATHLFHRKNTWKFPDFIQNKSLELCSLDSINYDFKLKFDFAISEKRISSFIEKVHYYSVCPSIDTKPKNFPAIDMKNNFKGLFLNKKYFDVTIRAGNEEFQVHKLVLRVRSPVFEAMFEQSMLESETGVVNVEDIDGETMRAFLEFIYTDDVALVDCAISIKLLLAADKYQVPSLVNKCATFLKSNLSVENACEIITIADSVNCESLKSFAFDFIIYNANKILLTADWEQWIERNVKLASKILFKLSTDLTRKYQ